MYPALAVLKALGEQANPVLWVGGQGGMEAGLVERAQVPFTSIPAAGVHGVGLRSLPRNLWQLSRGVSASRRIVNEFKPDVVFFTGGYVAAPMAVAARRIPTLLYVPDVEPGLALKFLGGFADCIALTSAESRGYFSKKARTVVTGYPTRPELAEWSGRKLEARQTLGITSDRPVLFVFGGSKGARSINRAVSAILPQLLTELEVVHITGTLDWDEIQQAAKSLASGQVEHYHTFPYLHEDMGAALAAADLVVSRAGASTLGEYPLFGLPAILVPYPYAWRYQKVNADYLVNRNAALLLPDEQLNEKLLETVLGLIHNPAQLQEMKQAMSGLNHPSAASEIANLALELAASKTAREGNRHG